MTFSVEKRVILGKSKNGALTVFLTALLCAACFFVPYMIIDNGYFLFFGDFNVQQIPFYQLAHNAVKSGQMGWSFYTDLGANFIGSYSFYILGSPFFWLTIPFPNSFLPYLMGPLLILKFGCAALTAYLYISRFTKNPLSAQIGAMLYAFSGFSIYNIFFNHFHEPIIFFPLLLLAFEYLITEKRRGFFAVMVAICAIVNYFFFVGMLVFGVIYMVIRFISKAVKPKFSTIFSVLFEAVIGIALATFILLPSYLAIAGADRVNNISLGWNSLLYGKESIYANIIEILFFPPDLPARPVMIPKADVKWSSLGAWLPIFSMVGVFAWCRAKKENWIRRMLLTCAVMAMVPILNSSFYLFNNAYYARWYFMPVLMMCLATSMAIEDDSVEWKKPFTSVSIITAGIALVIGLFPQKEKDSDEITIGLFTKPNESMYIFRFLVTVAIPIIGLAALGFILRQKSKNLKRFMRTAFVSVAICSVVYANFFIAWGKSHSYSNTDMIDNLIESDLSLEENRDNYRIDVYSGIDNTAMFLGYQSINCFHSIVPVSVTEFYKFIGEERGVASRPKTDSYPIRSLLSVKYLLQRSSSKEQFEDEYGNTKMYGFNYLREEQGYKIYSNENYIPYGFTYDVCITRENSESFSNLDKSKLLLKAIILNEEQYEKYGYMYQNYYDYYDGEERWADYSDETMKVDAANRRSTASSSFELQKNGFKAVMNSDKETLAFFSLPYDEGFSAYVNGEKVNIEKVNVGFMAVPIKSGENEIVFIYKTPGLINGTVISLGSLLLFIAYVLVFSKRRPLIPDYPEGEELLKKWQEYVLEIGE